MIDMTDTGEPHLVRLQVTDFMRNNTPYVTRPASGINGQ